MENAYNIKLFENQEIRTAWDEEKGKWFFLLWTWSGVLTE